MPLNVSDTWDLPLKSLAAILVYTFYYSILLMLKADVEIGSAHVEIGFMNQKGV